MKPSVRGRRQDRAMTRFIPEGIADRLLARAEGVPTEVAGMTILGQAMEGQLMGMLPMSITDELRQGTARVDWDHALEVSANWSGCQRRVLALAASLAGNGNLIDLADVLTGLDGPTSALVSDALRVCLTKTDP